VDRSFTARFRLGMLVAVIVLTTPTGQIGHQVLEQFLDNGEPVRVIARDPARIPARAWERVEVVQGSHGDPDVVDRAFAGADSVFWVAPSDPHADSVEAAYVGFTRLACEALTRHAVTRVVGVSAVGRGTAVAGNAGHVTASLAMDDLIASTGVSYRALTMPPFMESLLAQVELIRTQCMFFSPISADRKLPTCATRDIAAAAVRLLLDDSWSGRGHVAVLGPEDLSHNDMAQILSDVLGKQVSFHQIPGDAFTAQLTGFGMTEPMAQAMLDMMVAKDHGLDDAEPRTAQSSTPTTFRQWCDDVLKPAVLDWTVAQS
jgi:uncharacterized protein YbjT (DUF2867 family)